MFLSEHGLSKWKKSTKRDGGGMTHLCLDGGKIDLFRHFETPNGVPDNIDNAVKIEEKFLDLYAKDITPNDAGVCQQHFLVELKTPKYHFFVDWDECLAYDSEDPDAWKRFDRPACLKTMLREIRRFFPDVEKTELDHLLTVVVCTADVKMCGSAEEPQIKIGKHLHFPHLIVGDHEAKLLHTSMIAALEREHHREYTGFWSLVLDPCVYDQNGLRMLGSSKVDKCPHCKGKSCGECHQGKVSGYRPYMVNTILDGSGELLEEETQKAKADYHYAVRLVSIRCIEETQADPRFKKFEGAPAYPEIEVSKRGGANAKGPTIKVSSEFEADKQGSKGMNLNRRPKLELSSTQRDAILSCIRRVNPDRYKNLCIMTASIYAGGTICVKVTGEGSSWCANVNRDHTQNTVYFVITHRGVSQKCFSRKPQPEGARCACLGFQTQLTPLLPEEISCIFQTVMEKSNDLPAVSKSQHKKLRKEVHTEVSKACARQGVNQFGGGGGAEFCLHMYCNNLNQSSKNREKPTTAASSRKKKPRHAYA